MVNWTWIGLLTQDEPPAEPQVEEVKCEMTSGDWSVVVQGALDAFAQMDVKEFESARAETHEGIPCLVDVVTPIDIALFHRMEMLYAFTQKDKGVFGGHAQAAHLAAPSLSLAGQKLINDGHPIHQWNSFAIEQVVGMPRSLSVPTSGLIFVDGTSRDSVPTDRPYLFQYVVNEKVVKSQFVVLDEGVPEYPMYIDPTLRVRLEPRYAWGAAGLTTAAVGATGIAYINERRFWNPETSLDELDSYRTKTNVWMGLGVGFGLTAVGLLSTSIVFGME